MAQVLSSQHFSCSSTVKSFDNATLIQSYINWQKRVSENVAASRLNLPVQVGGEETRAVCASDSNNFMKASPLKCRFVAALR